MKIVTRVADGNLYCPSCGCLVDEAWRKCFGCGATLVKLNPWEQTVELANAVVELVLAVGAALAPLFGVLVFGAAAIYAITKFIKWTWTQ